MSEQRLKDWYEGRIPDEELTLEEVRWLEEAVFNAVERKLADFLPHDTIQ